MPRAVIAYDKDLPEIPGRCPWEKPTSFLVKDTAAPTGWREDRISERFGYDPDRLVAYPDGVVGGASREIGAGT